MSIPKIEPITIQEYEVKQSKYQVVGKLQNLFNNTRTQWKWKDCIIAKYELEIYNDLFNRIYIFSPSTDVDSSGIPVKTIH